jgi:hypothetical protein
MQGLKELQELYFILAPAGTVRTELTVELQEL